jgi:uncharacterized repeat protein (TIGR01451 family)
MIACMGNNSQCHHGKIHYKFIERSFKIILTIIFIIILVNTALAVDISLDPCSLPSSQGQGWSYLAFANSRSEGEAFSIQDTSEGCILHQNTIGVGYQNQGSNGYTLSNVVDPKKPFTLKVRARVTQEQQANDYNHWGFCFEVGTGTESFGIGISPYIIAALDNEIASKVLSTSIDNRVYHDYRLEATPGVGYSFYVDNILVGTGLPRMEGDNRIYFGDGTGGCNAIADIASFEFTQEGITPNTIFEDDFSTDKAWISNPPTDIYRDSSQENVDFHTHRGSLQYMYHTITPLQDNFELSIDANLESTNANGFIYIGLTDDINDVNWYWKGLGIVIGEYAGYHFAQVAAKYSDGSMYFSLNDDPAKDKHIGISINKWYTYKLTKNGQKWRLDAYDENKNSAGSISGEFTGSFSMPFNYVLFGNGDTSQWETADGKIDNFKLSSITTPALSSIGDLVWNDVDKDGIQDQNENGIEGVTVNLYKLGETVALGSTQTDPNGLYIFDSLEPGEYLVEFVLPSDDFIFGQKDRGDDDQKDSDADPITGKTGIITVTQNENNLSLDAAMCPNGLPSYIYPIYDYVQISSPPISKVGDLNKSNLEQRLNERAIIEFEDIKLHIGKSVENVNLKELGESIQVDKNGDISISHFDIYRILAKGYKTITIDYSNNERTVNMAFSINDLDSASKKKFLESHSDISGFLGLYIWNGRIILPDLPPEIPGDRLILSYKIKRDDLDKYYSGIDDMLKLMQFTYILFNQDVRLHIRNEIDKAKSENKLTDDCEIYKEINKVMETMGIPIIEHEHNYRGCDIEIPDMDISEEYRVSESQNFVKNRNILGFNDKIRAWMTVDNSDNPYDPGGVILHVQTNIEDMDKVSGLMRFSIMAGDFARSEFRDYILPMIVTSAAATPEAAPPATVAAKISKIIEILKPLAENSLETIISFVSVFWDYYVDVAIPIVPESTPQGITDLESAEEAAKTLCNSVGEFYYPLVSPNQVKLLNSMILANHQFMGMCPVTLPLDSFFNYLYFLTPGDLRSQSISLHFNTDVNPLKYDRVITDISQEISTQSNSNVNLNYNINVGGLPTSGSISKSLDFSFDKKITYPNAVLLKTEGISLKDLIGRLLGCWNIFVKFFIDIPGAYVGYLISIIPVPVADWMAGYIFEEFTDDLLEKFVSSIVDVVQKEIQTTLRSVLGERIYNHIFESIDKTPINVDIYLCVINNKFVPIPMPSNFFTHFDIPISFNEMVSLPLGLGSFRIDGSTNTAMNMDESGTLNRDNLLYVALEKYSRYLDHPTVMIIIKSPINVDVKTPKNIIFGSNYRSIPGFNYTKVDFNKDGKMEEVINITGEDYGLYYIYVTPKADAKLTDTYGIQVVSYGKSINLAEDVPISLIPRKPYSIEMTTNRTIEPITIGKIAYPSSTAPGAFVNFSINITNTGTLPLNHLKVFDRLPDGLSYISDNRSGSISGRNITWDNLGNLDKAASTFINIIAQIDPNASGNLINLAETSGIRSGEKLEEVSNSAISTVKVLKPGIKVEKTLGLKEPIQYIQFCENKKVSGTGKMDASTSVIDKDLALNYQTSMAGDGAVELDSESAVSEKSSKLMRKVGNNSTPLNLYESTKMSYSGDTPLTGKKGIQSNAFYDGIGANIQEAFSALQMEKDQQTFFASTDPASGASDQEEINQLRNASATYLVGMNINNSFNGTWGTDSSLHKPFYKDILAHQSFTGSFEIQKLIKFHENPVSEPPASPCEGLDC